MTSRSNLNTIRKLFSWSSAWYSSSFYKDLSFRDMVIDLYLSSLFYKLKFATSYFSIRNTFLNIHIVECDVYLWKRSSLFELFVDSKMYFKYLSLFSFFFKKQETHYYSKQLLNKNCNKKENNLITNKNFKNLYRYNIISGLFKCLTLLFLHNSSILLELFPIILNTNCYNLSISFFKESTKNLFFQYIKSYYHVKHVQHKLLNRLSKHKVSKNKTFNRFSKHKISKNKTFNRFSKHKISKNKTFNRFSKHKISKNKTFNKCSKHKVSKNKLFNKFLNHKFSKNKTFNKFLKHKFSKKTKIFKTVRTINIRRNNKKLPHYYSYKYIVNNSFFSYYIALLKKQHIRHFQFNITMFRSLISYLFFSISTVYSSKYTELLSEQNHFNYVFLFLKSFFFRNTKKLTSTRLKRKLSVNYLFRLWTLLKICKFFYILTSVYILRTSFLDMKQQITDIFCFCFNNVYSYTRNSKQNRITYIKVYSLLQLLTLKYNSKKYNFFLYMNYYSVVLCSLVSKIEQTLFSYTNNIFKFFPNFYHIQKPFITNSKLLCEFVVLSLESNDSVIKVFKSVKRWHTRQLNNWRLRSSNVLKTKIKGVSKIPLSGLRIVCKGPPYKARRKRKLNYHTWVSDDSITGKMPLQSLKCQIDYYQSFAILKRATIGIKVWTLFQFIK